MDIHALRSQLAYTLNAEDVVIEDDSHAHAGHAGVRSLSPMADSKGQGAQTSRQQNTAPSPLTHVRIRVVSAAFKGLPRVARHRLVYDALRDAFADGLHAAVIEAIAPQE